VRIWNHRSQRQEHAEPAHKNTVYGVAYSPNGKLLASAGFDRTIHVWSVEG